MQSDQHGSTFISCSYVWSEALCNALLRVVVFMYIYHNLLQHDARLLPVCSRNGTTSRCGNSSRNTSYHCRALFEHVAVHVSHVCPNEVVEGLHHGSPRARLSLRDRWPPGKERRRASGALVSSLMLRSHKGRGWSRNIPPDTIQYKQDRLARRLPKSRLLTPNSELFLRSTVATT